ncbi:MAG: cofactor-independent phosphoglycerate mutase [Candidatus Cloacimonetes bacterium]|nr:cofactor-independent phosphoglycerate mutase [Candidatus Cloacimonadota bacterium]
MKYIIILGDGMADRPLASLQNKTPLMVANIPNIHTFCRLGSCGLYQTVPLDMPPGSEVANLAVLGYDVHQVYQGRGVLEAASLNIPITGDDLVMRCNLICIESGLIRNHSAGHIGTEEAHQLIDFLNTRLADEQVRFYPGFSFRHVLVVKNGMNDLKLTPPHDVPGKPFASYLAQATSARGEATANKLNELILASQRLLPDHPVNRSRMLAGRDPANSIWPWSAGYKPQMPTFQDKFGIRGAVISAVDIIKGLGLLAGMDVIPVAGATGLIDTNYEGKAEAAVQALQDHDLIYLHVEATDEAGHAGEVDLKIKALELLDQRVVKRILEAYEESSQNLTVAILPDHATPCEVRTHTHDPVPFLICNPLSLPDQVEVYQEESVRHGRFGLIRDDQFIRLLLNRIH